MDRHLVDNCWRLRLVKVICPAMPLVGKRRERYPSRYRLMRPHGPSGYNGTDECQAELPQSSYWHRQTYSAHCTPALIMHRLVPHGEVLQGMSYLVVTTL